jgi:hypothetical protein
MSLYSLTSESASSFSDLLSHYTADTDSESCISPSVSLYHYPLPDSECASPPPFDGKCASTAILAEPEAADVPPPAYVVSVMTPKPKSSSKPRSRFVSFFTGRNRRSRSSSFPPPPYVSTEEITLMEERLKQLDIFFGGAAL